MSCAAVALHCGYRRASGVDEGVFAPAWDRGGSTRSNVGGAQHLLFWVMVVLLVLWRFLLQFWRMALEPHAGENPQDNKDC